MRSITGALILVLLITAVGSAVVTDIVGYVFYQDYDTVPIQSTCAARPVDGASITLYKRSSSSATGWEVYNSTGVTDSDGYYVFEDINVGNSLNDLCTYSDWFRIEVDATDCLPDDWNHPVILDRFSHNEIRPAGIPDPGTIRIDAVYTDTEDEYIPNSGSAATIIKIEGHFAVEHDLGFYFSPGDNPRNIGTCPIGSNRAAGGGCLLGHWKNMAAISSWSSISAYSEFIHTYRFEETQPYVEIGRNYFYYSHRWPDLATHIFRDDYDLIMRDFVYHLPEPSHPENSASSFDCSDTGDLEAVQVWPNPSSSSANLSFSVTESCDIELSLFDLSGRLVSVLAQGTHEAGEYTVQTDNLSSGIYLCRFKAGTSISTTRVIIE